jgi:hypothetical protein
VSGDLTLDLDLDPSGHYELGTLSGNVALRMDDEPDVDVSVTTMAGRVDSDFPIKSDRGPIGRRFSGRVGSGGADLRIKTLSGRVALLGRART